MEKSFIPFHSKITGDCSFCSTKNTRLVSPIDLKDRFELLASTYKEDQNGTSLITLLKDDWALFPNLDNANAQRLLAEILDNGEIVRKKYEAKHIDSFELDHWNNLSNELKHNNRFFGEIFLDLGRLEEYLSHLLFELVEISNKWYRARRQYNQDPFSIDQMGAPPKELANSGRANPEGIPYLYLATNIETAVSEIRPHTGEYISIAEFEINEQLKVVDLRDPRKNVSPFGLAEEEEIIKLRVDMELLIRLGNELTRPVLPDSASINYIPSQYLCEFIKKCNYDGVIYNSAMGKGSNLALFQPKKYSAKRVSTYMVDKVSFEVIEI
ncbi:MAG: RES family NAD+ phosphorylase [Sumerlaeia bacterium]